MADKPETPKKPEPAKKNVKKLTIIDANEEVKDEAPAAEPEQATPAPLADEEELAAIAEAFADVPEETPAVEVEAAPAKTPRKISITEHVEEPVETPEELPEEAPAEEPAETPVEEPEVAEEPVEPAGEVETTTAPEVPADEIVEDDLEIEEPTEDTELAEEPVTPKRPLSQLTNNVPAPPKAVEDVVSEIEPEKEFSDDQTASAVDDIVARESDELFAREDAAAEQVVKPVKKRRSLKGFFSAWWNSRAARWGTLVGLLLLIMLIVALPATRYSILNAAGVRVRSSVTVLSNESQQPLKNAQVTVGGQTAVTDENGKASFQKLRMGKTDVEINKRGYASIQTNKVLGWGSNPLGSMSLTLTGTKLIFSTKDYLSGLPVTSAEAVSGEYNAQADDKGKIILAVDQNNEDDIVVTIKSDGYREEKVTIKATDKGEKKVEMVAGRPRAFVSKRSGKLDVYKVDADGKNESVLLAATGKERNDLAVLQQPDGDYTAVVSTRIGTRNKEGYLLSNLFILNNKTAELTKLNESERIQLVDWTDDRIIFIAVTEGASAANPSRSKIFSYQIGQPGAKQIASANYFNDAIIFKGSLYYAPSSYAVPVSSVKFYRVNPDGSNQASLLSSEVWNIFRSDFDSLQLSVQQDWYELESGTAPSKLSTSPTNPKSRVYRVSPDDKHAVWVDNRDGKGVLVSYDTDTKQDTVLLSQSGLALPVYWLNNTTLVYRVSDGRETADYVRSTAGGESKKLKDVTSTDSSNYFN